MKKLKIAIIGCGRVSKTAHYKALEINSNFFDFVAVCDTDKERADYWAKKNNVKAYYSTEELFENEELDIVSINTPNGLHSKHGMEAAGKKIHVICEKPLGMNIEEVDALIDYCETQGVKLFNVLQNRYNETNKILKACIDKGRFGRVISCNIILSWRRELGYYTEDGKWRSRRDLAGGVFTNQAVHYIDMMQWLVGVPPETVYAKMGTIYPVDVEDYGAGIIKFRNGVIGSLVLTNHAYPSDMEGSITIIGERGMVKIAGKSMNKVEIWNFQEKSVEDELIKNAASNPPTVYGFGHNEFYQRVGDYLINGTGEEFIVTGRDGRKSVALLEGLYLSDKLSKEVAFPLGKR